MYIDRPLVGVKEKVFDTIEEFSSVECEYLIAYIPDIVWGDTLEILSIFRILIFFFDKKFIKFVPIKPEPPVIKIFFIGYQF